MWEGRDLVKNWRREFVAGSHWYEVEVHFDLRLWGLSLALWFPADLSWEPKCNYRRLSLQFACLEFVFSTSLMASSMSGIDYIGKYSR